MNFDPFGFPYPWASSLQYISRIGTVHRITDRGDVRVQYSNNIRWTFHPGALTKVRGRGRVFGFGSDSVRDLLSPPN